jgi:hypothetical protein
MEAAAVLHRADAPARAPQGILDALDLEPLAAVILFAAPGADLGALGRAAALRFPGAAVIGCTTAGEITAEGYAEGRVVGVGLPDRLFAVDTVAVPDLAAFRPEALIGRVMRARAALAAARPGWAGEFGFLLVDGLSAREDALAAALSAGLGPVPLFGGSAGDGVRFRRTEVLAGGAARSGAAVMLVVRTACAVRVFNLDHLMPTETRMVVTRADPARRIVQAINGEPAAREYARLAGKDPGQLSPFTFAAHPVVVRIGGRHHVRAIREVAGDDLIFYAAIDEGLVLTLARPQDIAGHLARELAALGDPAAILACDCILRRMEAAETQATHAVSALLRRHRVTGFSTYGEQRNGMHVNQTMTGVALYPP